MELPISWKVACELPSHQIAGVTVLGERGRDGSSQEEGRGAVDPGLSRGLPQAVKEMALVGRRKRAEGIKTFNKSQALGDLEKGESEDAGCGGRKTTDFD